MRLKIFLYLALAFAMLCVHEYSPIWSFSYFKSDADTRYNMTKSLHHSSTSEAFYKVYPFEIDSTELFDFDKNTNFNVIFEYSGNIKHGQRSRKDRPLKNKENNIYVRISNDKEVDWGQYMPLVKNISFSCRTNFYWSGNIILNHKIIDFSNSGTVHTTGEQRIYGICSTRRANETIDGLINKNLEQELYNEVQKQMDDIYNEFIKK